MPVAVRRTRPRSARLLVISLISASLAIITLDYRQGADGPLASLGRVARSTMAPLQSAVTAVTEPVGDFFSGLANLPSLADENERLVNEVDDLRTKVAVFAEQERELETLYDLLGLTQLHPSAVPAVVIGNGVSNFDWSITIDKGAADGLAVDMPVVTGTPEAPRLVGKIVSITDHSADVQLVIDRDYAVAGTLSDPREVGLIVGQGEQDLRMDLITPGTAIDVEAGSVEVFTVSYQVHGEEGLYPPGLLIGTVSRVFEDANDLQTAVSVRPAVDFSSLDFVLVLMTARPQEPAS